MRTYASLVLAEYDIDMVPSREAEILFCEVLYKIIQVFALCLHTLNLTSPG